MGTPALTTRGMRDQEMRTIGHLIVRALQAHEDEGELTRIRGEVRELCEAFPAPGLLQQ